MSNILTFPGRSSLAPGNPSFDLPTENVAEVAIMVPWSARRLRPIRSEPVTEAKTQSYACSAGRRCGRPSGRWSIGRRA